MSLLMRRGVPDRIPFTDYHRAWRIGLGLAAAATYAVAGACWLQERRTLTRRGLDKDARAAVALKDVFVTGAVLTGVARLAGEAIVGRDTTAGAAGPRRRLRAVRLLNRAFVAGAVAATPFINFALFNDYRPRPLRGFISL